MKLRRRIVSLCMVLLMVCCTQPVSAESASGTCGELLTWTLTDGVLTISGTGEMWDFRTAEHPLIADWKSADTLVIADGVTSIGAWAFYGCGALSLVTIAASVRSIGAYAFYNCKALPALTLPQGVEHIGERAFLFCSAMQSLTLPDSVTTLDYGAFWGCSSLTTLEIPPNIEFIGANAFADCAFRTVYFNAANCATTATEKEAPFQIAHDADFTIILGDSVRSLPSFLCYKKTSGTYNVRAASWDAYLRIQMQYKPFAGSDGFQLYIGDELIEDLVLPDTVTEIGSNQFSNCGSIRTATFGDAIRSVGDHAFAKCRRLQRITLLSAEPVTFGSGAFYEAPVVRFDYAGTQADYLNLRFGAEAFYLSNTWYIAYDEMTLYIDGKAVTDFVVPDDTTEIGTSQFNRLKLRSLTLPGSVQSIADEAFYLTALQELNYTGTLTDWCGIHFSAPTSNPLRVVKRFFVDGKRVSYLQIPDGVTQIGDYQFTDGSVFSGIRLPDSVRSIGKRAILCEEPLQYIHIPSGVETIDGNYAYYAKPDALVICSDAADCEAARFAERSGIPFRVCENHAHMHDFVQTSLQPETCTASGKANWQCTVCGETYSETIAPTGHLYEQTYTEGICGEQGSLTFTCTVCGDSYDVPLPAPGQHAYVSEITTEATCGEQGEKTYTCSICGHSYTETIEPTGAHEYTYVDVTPATCSAKGSREYTCTVCGFSYTIILYPTGQHDYQYTILTEATCGAPGKREGVCSVCGSRRTEDIPATLAHTWTEWTTAQEPSTELGGIYVRVCTSCGASETKTTPPLPVPLTLNTQSLTLVYKQTAVLTASQNATWRSSDERVVQVDDSGGITAVGTGTAEVTATSTENGQTAVCTVTVRYAWWQQLIRIVLFGFLWY